MFYLHDVLLCAVVALGYPIHLLDIERAPLTGSLPLHKHYPFFYDIQDLLIQ